MNISTGYNVEDIIGSIYVSRKEINKVKHGIENAEFRLQHAPNAPLWVRIKEEEIKKLEKANKKFENLVEQLMSSKTKYSEEEYKMLLQKFGYVLAMTEDINHIQESLYDERDLNQALDQTSDMIQQKRKELIDAKENNNEDLIIVIDAEIDYYETDMKKHYWGETRLESLYSDENKKLK